MGVSIKGGDINAAAVESVAAAILAIFEGAAENRMEQDTVVHAINALSKAGSVENTAITNCNIG